MQGDGAVDLLNERIDVALTFVRPDEKSFIARKLIDDLWVVCASPEYPAGAARRAFLRICAITTA
ncbi:MAG: hypothetical protein HC850_16105 [Rhodomicrobium sp.]|nr:hypothetical protein [Rhodomicrobium sp.]